MLCLAQRHPFIMDHKLSHNFIPIQPGLLCCTTFDTIILIFAFYMSKPSYLGLCQFEHESAEHFKDMLSDATDDYRVVGDIM